MEPRAPRSIWDRVALPLGIGVATPLIVAAVVALFGWLTRSPAPVDVNIELIVDVSDQMDRRFGGSTRFDAAIAELVDLVEPRDSDNLALWTSGGSCGEESTEEVVPIGQGNSDEIQAALAELEPRGRANLGDAIVEATGTFSDPERLRRRWYC
jgi:von Willebrand factor type A domain